MKFSIITPSYNSEEFISESLWSVASQRGDFEIEHIIIDNQSTDDTIRQVSNYADLLNNENYPIGCRRIDVKFVSEPDFGMYDAINKGFNLATGDIYAWLNSDDMYLPGAFQSISRVFSQFSQVNWAKGITSYMDKYSSIYQIGKCHLYSRELISKGLYGTRLPFIQQDSIFWRSSTWRECGGCNANLKLAGDFDLWVRFAKLNELYSINVQLSCFRRHRDQLSQNLNKYFSEISSIHPNPGFKAKVISHLYSLSAKTPHLLRPSMLKLAFGKLDFHLIHFSRDDEKPALISGKYSDVLGFIK